MFKQLNSRLKEDAKIGLKSTIGFAMLCVSVAFLPKLHAYAGYDWPMLKATVEWVRNLCGIVLLFHWYDFIVKAKRHLRPSNQVLNNTTL
ncbi:MULTISPECIES: hypothetical protein [Stutzerimonas]|uniref:hypothetical protein n=1 Tax=Stutzerimonas TaxID=2901164 RepID=UPI000F7955E9|nr:MULTISPECIES: hypothetical protein [Stutzerimonas]MDH0084162.1 hypothetical protein [Stutzerimonas stutzeri]